MNDFKLKGNTEALLDAYQRDGVVRIREFFSQEIVTEIRNELERYMRDDLSSLPADAKTTEKDSKTIRNLWRLELYNKFFQEQACVGRLGCSLSPGQCLFLPITTRYAYSLDCD